MRSNPIFSLTPRSPDEFQYASKQFSKCMVSEFALEDAFSICNRLTRSSDLSKLTVRDGSRVLLKMRVVIAPKSYVHDRARRLFFDASEFSPTAFWYAAKQIKMQADTKRQ